MRRAKFDQPPRLVLASASPRRSEILQHLGLAFDSLPVDVDERPRRHENAPALARRLALAKADAARVHRPDAWILAADTVVTVGGRLLGKPRGRRDAGRMLRQLSGVDHDVVTALALWSPTRSQAWVRHATTRVRFAPLSAEEIRRYLDSDEPWDKAGSYALQGTASWFVASVRGSVSNVIGLPVERLRQLFQRANLPLPALRATSINAPILRGTRGTPHSPSAQRRTQDR